MPYTLLEKGGDLSERKADVMKIKLNSFFFQSLPLSKQLCRMAVLFRE